MRLTRDRLNTVAITRRIDKRGCDKRGVPLKAVAIKRGGNKCDCDCGNDASLLCPLILGLSTGIMNSNKDESPSFITWVSDFTKGFSV